MKYVNVYRICPGRFFADATIWLTVANVLAFFDIGPIVDPESGKVLPPDGSYHSGFTSLVAYLLFN